MTALLQEQLQQLPTEPGIYKYFDDQNELIYVGKAVNLRNRVKSYFSGPQSPKTQVLVSNIVRLETIVVQSEIDALILEANLIKEHRPRYNIILKDDKSHLYLKITTYEDFPRISTCRQTDIPLDPKALYFGPYPSSGTAKQTLRYLRRVFPYLAHHQPPVTGRRRPPQSYFYYNLPLISDSTPLDKRTYRQQVFQLVYFLEGKRQAVAQDLERQMREAARALQFEQAAEIKQQLDGIAYMTQRTISPDQYLANPELLQEKRESGLADLAAALTPYFPQLQGLAAADSEAEPHTLHRLECYDISNTGGEQSVGSMVVFIDGEASKRDYRKFKIKQDGKPNDFAMMEEVLTRRFKRLNRRVSVDAGSTASSDQEDASFSATPDLIMIDGGKGQLSAARTVLQRLGLEIPIVGLTKRYEELVIQSVGGRETSVDASLDEVLPVPTPQAPTLADGVSSARPTKAKRSGAHGAIARSDEEASTQTTVELQYTILRLARGSEALFLIQRLRDEAHRFAITYHRKLRAKAFLPKT